MRVHLQGATEFNLMWKIGGVILTALVVSTACKQDNLTKCRGGFVSVGGQCQQVCRDNRDCSEPLVCSGAGLCIAVDPTAVPEITSIDSDGEVDSPPYAAHRIGTRLIIQGANLGAVTQIRLDSSAGTSFSSLQISQASDIQLAVNLPIEIENETPPLSYTLVVVNQAGSAQASVTLLRGADGASLTGEQIIVNINQARGTGSLLVADRLGVLAPTDIATSLEINSLDARVSDLESQQGSASPEDVCPGFLHNGVCVTSYNNTGGSPGANWAQAVQACATQKVDLCTPSQYAVLRDGEQWGDNHFNLFYSSLPVWSNNFSDNDGGNIVFLRTNDDPLPSYSYGYACCSTILPEPQRSRVTTYTPQGGTSGVGVWVTSVHAIADTTFPAAAYVCAALHSDVCSKSQYVALNDNNVFGGTTPTIGLWSHDMSDNDSDYFDSIMGASVPDNNGWTNKFGYACCASPRPLNGSCPGNDIGGVCTALIHDAADADFPTAARACTALGVDVCSKSQMQKLRDFNAFTGTSWTRDGADNDSQVVGGLAGASQPDNPNPTSNTFGYACCY